MKIRTGFVSNSSTSSFVAIVAKDNFDETFEGFEKREINLMMEAFKERETTLFGKEVYVFSGRSDEEGCTEIMDLEDTLTEDFPEKYDHSEPWEFADDFYDQVCNALKSNKDNFYSGEYR